MPIAQRGVNFPELVEIMPASSNQPYDMKKVIATIVDDGDYMEYFPHWAMNLTCGFARINGHVVGIVGRRAGGPRVWPRGRRRGEQSVGTTRRPPTVFTPCGRRAACWGGAKWWACFRKAIAAAVPASFKHIRGRPCWRCEAAPRCCRSG